MSLKNKLIKIGERNPDLQDNIEPILDRLKEGSEGMERESKIKTAGKDMWAVVSGGGYLYTLKETEEAAQKWLNRQTPDGLPRVVKLEDVPNYLIENVNVSLADNFDTLYLDAKYNDAWEAWDALEYYYNE